MDNKYYTARLKCITKEGEEARQHELPEQHEFDAAVLVVDTLDAHSLAIVKAQLSHLAERNVSVLVVADAAHGTFPDKCYPECQATLRFMMYHAINISGFTGCPFG